MRGDPRPHKYFEVETTLLPKEECRLQSDRIYSTKVCTGYLPHKPSIYEFRYDNSTRDFTLERYLGGYYRDFVPKMVRRRSKIRFDYDGNPEYESIPRFHKGFPRKYKTCHKYSNGISDMGAPTYWRLARLQTQMTSERGTKDKTQEPQDNGQSIVVLSSIQSGYSEETGAKCDEVDGFYTDEEINIQAAGILEWIKAEIQLLPSFFEMFEIEKDGLRKVVNQKVTTADPKYAKFTTPITTIKEEFQISTTLSPKFQVDVLRFDPEDYYDPALWDKYSIYE